MFLDVETTIHLLKATLHVVLAIFFFAIWQGPGQRRLTWLLWTLAFVIDMVQAAMHLCGTAFCASQWGTWINFGLSLLWLWIIITASYTWRPGNGDGGIRKWPYVFGTAWMLIMIVGIGFGIQFSRLAMSVYMLGVMLFLGHVYARVGGVLLGIVGMWAGGGDSLTKMTAAITGIEMTVAGTVMLTITVEVASLVLFLTILYLYLDRIRKERDAYECQLQVVNEEQRQVLGIAADLVQMGNVAAQEDLDGSTMRYNGGLAAGEHV